MLTATEKFGTVIVELEKLNHTDAAPESMRYIYARILCREAANKALPNKQARCDRVFQLPTPDGFRLPMKKEITNAKHYQISEQRAGSYQYQRHPVFKGSSNWGHLAISQRLPRCSENFSTSQKRIYPRHDAFNRTADQWGQTVDERLFSSWCGIDCDVCANTRRGAISGVHFGRFGRQTVDQSPSRTDERPQGGAVAALPRMGKDFALSSGGAVRSRNRQSHREKPFDRQSGFTAYARLRLSRSPCRSGTQIRSAFPAVRRVKQWGKSLKCPKNGFINPTSIKKSKTVLQTANLRCAIWNWREKLTDSFRLSVADKTFVTSYALPLLRRQGFACLKGI